MHLFDLSPHIVAFLCEFSQILKAKNFVVTKFGLISNFVEGTFVKIFVRNFITTKFFVVNYKKFCRDKISDKYFDQSSFDDISNETKFCHVKFRLI